MNNSGRFDTVTREKNSFRRIAQCDESGGIADNLSIQVFSDDERWTRLKEAPWRGDHVRNNPRFCHLDVVVSPGYVANFHTFHRYEL